MNKLKMALIVLSYALCSTAYAAEGIEKLTSADFDVSIVKSKTHEGYETVMITVRDCVTTFDIKMEDLKKALNAKIDNTTNKESEAMSDMITKSLERYQNHCH